MAGYKERRDAILIIAEMSKQNYNLADIYDRIEFTYGFPQKWVDKRIAERKERNAMREEANGKT